MSYQPQTGDRVTLRPNHSAEYEVIGVHNDWVWLSLSGGDAQYTTIISRCVKVEPRPTIAAEQWGYINGQGRFCEAADSCLATYYAERVPTRTPARIIDGRVCDAHGEPFEVTP